MLNLNGAQALLGNTYFRIEILRLKYLIFQCQCWNTLVFQHFLCKSCVGLKKKIAQLLVWPLAHSLRTLCLDREILQVGLFVSQDSQDQVSSSNGQFMPVCSEAVTVPVTHTIIDDASELVRCWLPGARDSLATWGSRARDPESSCLALAWVPVSKPEWQPRCASAELEAWACQCQWPARLSMIQLEVHDSSWRAKTWMVF